MNGIKCDWHPHERDAEWVLVIGDLATQNIWTVKACHGCYNALTHNLGDTFWDPNNGGEKTADMIEARRIDETEIHTWETLK